MLAGALRSIPPLCTKPSHWGLLFAASATQLRSPVCVEAVGDLTIAGDTKVATTTVSPLPPSRHDRRRASSGTSAATLGLPVCLPGHVERVGAELGVGDLAVGEEIGRSAPLCPVGAADMRALDVSERERTGRFLIFWILNSAVTLEIYRKIIIALKTLKIYV